MLNLILTRLQPRGSGSQHCLSVSRAVPGTNCSTLLEAETRWQNPVFRSRRGECASLHKGVKLPAPKKSYHFDTTFFIHYGVMAYLLFVGRTRRMTQDTASGMHHALACISSAPLELYIITHKSVFSCGLMIYTFCESD